MHPPHQRRLPALDALRGLAITIVLAHHFAPQVAMGEPLVRMVSATLQLGWVGVDLFFVLSGFLITGILLDGRGDAGAQGAAGHSAGRLLAQFYGRRALRILPLYYGVLATLIVVALGLRMAGRGGGAGQLLLDDQAWYWLHGANFAAARDTQWAPDSWVQHFWSLAVEEQFYLVWPLIVLALPRRMLAPAMGLTVLGAFVVRASIAMVGEHPVGAYVLTPARADALAAGALLAVAWRTPGIHAQLTRTTLIAIPVLMLALGALVATSGPNPHRWLMATVGHSYWALLFAALLWLAIVPMGSSGDVRARVWQAWLERQRWLHWMARYSYGLYVVHYPLRALQEHLSLTAADFHPEWGFGIATMMGFAIGAGASLIVAVPLWHCFEAPIIARGGAWLGRRTAARWVEDEGSTSDGHVARTA